MVGSKSGKWDLASSHLLIMSVVCALALAWGSPASGQQSEVEALRDKVERLEAVVEQLRLEVEEAETEPSPAEPEESTSLDGRLTEIERQIAVLAEELEDLAIGEAAETVPAKGEFGLGTAASRVYMKDQGLSIGGYGEMLFESFSSRREDGSPSAARDQADFLRGVLYFGYRFDDRWLFNSEIEFEHASTGEEGSASVEFAYLDYLHRPELNVRAGLLLLPMGIVNELHEPTLFLSAQRPSVERNILASTWRENGVGVFGDLGPFSYRTYVVNGLDASGFSSSGVRGGRQKGSKALAEDFALTGRLDYTGTPGLIAGASFYSGDSGQGLVDSSGQVIDAATEIVDLHLDWKWRGLEVRGLYARVEIEDVARLNRALGLTTGSSIGETMTGFYGEVGFDLLSRRRSSARAPQAALVPFFRYETLDTQDSVPFGFEADPQKDARILTFGLAFRPIDPLIFKLDYQDWSDDANQGVDQWNLGLGYIF